MVEVLAQRRLTQRMQRMRTRNTMHRNLLEYSVRVRTADAQPLDRPMTDEEIINGYLMYVERDRVPRVSLRTDAQPDLVSRVGATSAEDEFFWAWEAVDDLIGKDPERAWRILLESLRRCSPISEPAIGAGPLEELIVREALRFADRVADELLTNSRFRSAYNSVYFSTEYLTPAEAELFNARLRARGVDPEFIPDWRIADPEGAV